MLITAIAIPATIAPYCFTTVECVWILMGLSLAATVATVGIKSRLTSVFSAIEFILAIGTYTFVLTWSPKPFGC